MQRWFNITILLLSILSFVRVPARADEPQPDSGRELEQLIAPENQPSKEDESPEKPKTPLEKFDPKELSDLGGSHLLAILR